MDCNPGFRQAIIWIIRSQNNSCFPSDTSFVDDDDGGGASGDGNDSDDDNIDNTNSSTASYSGNFRSALDSFLY